MIAYKYKSEFSRDINLLRQSKLYAPTIDKLNDPYEGLVEPIILFQLKAFEEYGKNLIDSVDNILKKKNSIGVVSLSKTYRDELLWAHYANSHKGFCIEIEVNYLIKTG